MAAGNIAISGVYHMFYCLCTYHTYCMSHRLACHHHIHSFPHMHTFEYIDTCIHTLVIYLTLPYIHTFPPIHGYTHAYTLQFPIHTYILIHAYTHMYVHKCIPRYMRSYIHTSPSLLRSTPIHMSSLCSGCLLPRVMHTSDGRSMVAY